MNDMIQYYIKAFMLEGDKLVNRFLCVVPCFTDVTEFLSRVNLDAYDVVKVYPCGYDE